MVCSMCRFVSDARTVQQAALYTDKTTCWVESDQIFVTIQTTTA